MKNKQTAVEYFYNGLFKHVKASSLHSSNDVTNDEWIISKYRIIELLKFCQQMEKEQMIDMWMEGNTHLYLMEQQNNITTKLMKKFVSYEQALSLKELGFNEECFAYYYNKELSFGARVAYGEIVESPLKSQVFRWFRENHELYANLFSWLHEEELGKYHEYEIYGNPNGVYGDGKYDTYEEAVNACIDKLIEIAKQQDNGK